MTPGFKGAALGFGVVLARQPGNQMVGNQMSGREQKGANVHYFLPNRRKEIAK